jgi:hypothetical protein
MCVPNECPIKLVDCAKSTEVLTQHVLVHEALRHGFTELGVFCVPVLNKMFHFITYYCFLHLMMHTNLTYCNQILYQPSEYKLNT